MSYCGWFLQWLKKSYCITQVSNLVPSWPSCYLFLFNIQQNCWLRKHLGKNMEYWVELLTLWQTEKLFFMSHFSYYHNVFKSNLLQMWRKVKIISESFVWPFYLYCDALNFLKHDIKLILHYRKNTVSWREFIHRLYLHIGDILDANIFRGVTTI